LPWSYFKVRCVFCLTAKNKDKTDTNDDLHTYRITLDDSGVAVMKLSLPKLLSDDALYRLLRPWLLKYSNDPKISDDQLRRLSTATWDCLCQWIACIKNEPVEARSESYEIIIPIMAAQNMLKELNMHIKMTWRK
jgi:hypothetical protein